jgi:membrane-associated phospholipid phosphatase
MKTLRYQRFFYSLLLGASCSFAELELNWKQESLLLATGMGLQLSGQWAISQGSANPLQGQQAFLAWDRPWVGQMDANSQLWSNLLTLGAAPILLDARIQGHGWKRSAQEILVYSQILAINSGINLWTRSLHVWRRPQTHHPDYNWDQAKPEAMGSFYSGHASAAFAIATSWMLMRKDRGDENLAWLGYGLATSIAALRVTAGKHYPSDVLVGALIGSGIGWGITTLHLKTAQNQESAISFSPPIQFTLQF